MFGNKAYSTDDTIVATATPSGPAARAVIRLCGPRVRDCLLQIWRPADGAGGGETDWSASQSLAIDSLSAVVRPTRLPGWAKLDDCGRCIPCDLYYWPDSRSFTRSPLAEIHCLGSDPLVAALVQQSCQHGARLAGGGEFTLRAFLGGRIDLTQAEAVLGVIQAKSEREFDCALKQLAGGLSEPLHEIRHALLDILADVEAGLDFADEDITFLDDETLRRRLGEIYEKAERLLAEIGNRQTVPLAGRVVLVGKPNAGKSSLFNALTGGQALESPQPGTTRDYLCAPLDLDGIQCELIDTAGVDFHDDGTLDGIPKNQKHLAKGIDNEAHATTTAQWEQASIQVFCLDVTADLSSDTLKMVESVRHSGGLVVLTKCDQLPESSAKPAGLTQVDAETSSHTGAGMETLRKTLRSRFEDGSAAGDGAVASTAIRCQENLQSVVNGLGEALNIADPSLHHELIAVEIRTAIDFLGQMVGAVYTEDMLDRIFSRFCIGK